MHYELRTWARSSNEADDDMDGIVDVGRYPGDEDGRAAGMMALGELAGDGGLLLGKCLESGIAAGDVVEVGAGLFRLEERLGKRTVRAESAFSVPLAGAKATP